LTGNGSRSSGRLDDLQLCQTLKSALGLRFSLRAEQFVFTAPGQVGGTEISEEALLVLVATTLAAQPEIFPPSHIRPRRLKRIIHLLRALCADAGEDTVHGLQQFVERRLALQAGSDVTSGEVYAGFVAFTASPLHASESVLSKHDFHRRLPGLIKKTFSLTQSHQIFRPAPAGRVTMRRGWRGLMLKDGTDGEDATDGKLISHPVPNLEPIQL